MAGEEDEGPEVYEGTLDDIFNDEESAESESVEEIETEPEASASPPSEEPGASTDETPSATPDEEDPTAPVPVAVHVQQRQRRREAEKALEETRRELAELKAAAAPPPPDPDEDPEGFRSYYEGSKFEAVRDMSFKMMRELVPDFDDMANHFATLVMNPDGSVKDTGLVEKMNAADIPARFVYDHAKLDKETAIFRDPKALETYKIKLEAEAREKVEREFEESRKAGAKPLTAEQVPSLYGTAARETKTDLPEGPINLEELFGDQLY